MDDIFAEAKSQIDALKYLATQYKQLDVQHRTPFKQQGAETLLKLHKLCLEMGERFNA